VIKHLLPLFGLGLTSLVVFVIYDDFRCKANPSSDCHMLMAFSMFGDLAPGNWSQWGISLYLAFGYSAWALGLALMTNYAADGNGGIITRILSHEIFNPLARLSYCVYLTHLIVIQLFYTKSPAEISASQSRQLLDTIAITAVTFFVAFFLYCFIEKPLTTLLPWCIGFDKEEKRSQRTRSVSMPLTRELSMVTDVDSESVIIGTPMRRPSMEENEQPLLRPQ
jgi:peptidoglycan/LPS O-acetylase OafA/YrhL